MSIIHNNPISKHCINIFNQQTFQFHTNTEAFLEATIWTSLPLTLVNQALLAVYARVDLIVLHSSLKKACSVIQDRNTKIVNGLNANLQTVLSDRQTPLF